MFVTVGIMHYITNTRAGILDCDYGFAGDVIDSVGSAIETIITEENGPEAQELLLLLQLVTAERLDHFAQSAAASPGFGIRAPFGCEGGGSSERRRSRSVQFFSAVLWLKVKKFGKWKLFVVELRTAASQTTTGSLESVQDPGQRSEVFTNCSKTLKLTTERRGKYKTGAGRAAWSLTHHQDRSNALLRSQTKGGNYGKSQQALTSRRRRRRQPPPAAPRYYLLMEQRFTN
ncbi:uncharacterized protein V6R79_010206 [Siganus canaliculatus]